MKLALRLVDSVLSVVREDTDTGEVMYLLAQTELCENVPMVPRLMEGGDEGAVGMALLQAVLQQLPYPDDET